MRLFVAADLPDATRREIASLQGRLRPMSLPVRWVAVEGIHLTWKFLGETGEDMIDRLAAGLEEAAAMSAPFLMEPRGLGAFPGRGRPRVIWLGLSGDLERASDLHRRIEAELGERGVAREARRFVPHLTLGRVTGPGRGGWRAALDAVAGVALTKFEVNEIVLFESHLRPAGASYLPLRRLPLRGAA